MKGQKQAVMETVQAMLPSLVLYKDIALVMLTKNQLEALKNEMACGMMYSTIEYSKDRTKFHEVRAYARSMVMNHLKKAKELNGNQVYGVGPVVVQSKSSKVASALDMSILPDDLKSFVQTLV